MMELTVAVLAGAVLAVVYFGGLWLTVRQITRTRRPGMWVLWSYLARLTILAVGFYVVVRALGGGALIAALLGLLVVRATLVRQLGHCAVEPGQSIPRPGRGSTACS